MENNLSIWEKYEKTDPKYVKPIPGDFKSTIDSHYRMKLMTEQFGPKGMGWGVKDEKYDFKQFGDDPHTTILIYTAVFWYKKGEFHHEYPIKHDVPVFKYQRKSIQVVNGFDANKKEYRWVQQEDLLKSVSTGALMKGFSELGFNVDVYMGEHGSNGNTRQNKGNQPQQSNTTQKPWLNKTDRQSGHELEEWRKAIIFIQKGGTVDDLKQEWKINSDNYRELMAIQNAVAQ